MRTDHNGNELNMRTVITITDILRKLLGSALCKFRQAKLRREQRRAMRIMQRQSVKRLVIGAGSTAFDGWTATDREGLDLLSEKDWGANIKPETLDAILAEHVWEHLTEEDGVRAARNCFRYLKPGGYLRIAVPDGSHPDPDYIDSVKPGGSGAGAEDHKVLYTSTTVARVFSSAGFEISFCEFFDESGTFKCMEWDPVDGMIQRSLRFDSRNADGLPHYTSIILDARKPRTRKE